ncbi:hypothetical protein AB685_08480 [Bacillus sp. LL01]|uniref:hypothetical protein n=1 Tax=Bacillus sp. LL01 TaxID=1665556 RepID=UPI00064D48A2|nr:hypothetical protein [Bacillus sp. LL01]KMJ59090.1 hypothetical protein AB685_08480 [Bacillus sp. LL01]
MSSGVFRSLERFISFIFFSVIGLIVGVNIFVTRGHHSISSDYPIYFKSITFIIVILLIVALIKFRQHIVRLLEKFPVTFWVAGFLGFSLFLQLVVVKLFAVRPSWDFGALVNGARLFLETGEVSSYLSIYPNNSFLFCLLVVIGKVFTPSVIVYLLFNIFIITFSQLLIFLIARKVAGNTIGMITLAVSVLFFPYIFFAPIVYTDTISLLFLLLPLHMLLDRNGEFRSNLSIILAAAFIFALGMLLKGSLIIFIIAFSITLFLYMKGWKKAYIVLPFVVLILVKILFNSALYQLDILNEKQLQQTSFPVSHWLVMAQNGERVGKYAENDVQWTKQLLADHSRSQVSEIHYQELENRVSEKGLQGNLAFNLEKIKHTWTDGTYYSLNKIKRNPVVPENITGLLDYKSGNLLQGYARVQHLILFIGLLFTASLYKDKRAFVMFCMLSIIGYFLFFLLWETRSRYLVSVTPLIILLSCMGYFKIKIRRFIG